MTAKQKKARRHNKEGGNHLDQESNSQKTMEDIAGGLHPAVDEQSLGERRKTKANLQGGSWKMPGNLRWERDFRADLTAAENCEWRVRLDGRVLRRGLLMSTYPKVRARTAPLKITICLYLACYAFLTVAACWLLNVPATCKCISGTDLLRQFYVLPHWDRSCRSNFPSHPVTVYWHRADQSQRWPYDTRRLAG